MNELLLLDINCNDLPSRTRPLPKKFPQKAMPNATDASHFFFLSSFFAALRSAALTIFRVMGTPDCCVRLATNGHGRRRSLRRTKQDTSGDRNVVKARAPIRQNSRACTPVIWKNPHFAPSVVSKPAVVAYRFASDRSPQWAVDQSREKKVSLMSRRGAEISLALPCGTEANRVS